MTEEENDYRQVIVQIWYPAKLIEDTAPAAYFPEVEWVRAGFKSQKGDFPQKLAEDFERYNRVLSYSLPGAMIDETENIYPLLLFATGGNMSRHFYTTMMEELASQGYIVAAISHPYSSMDFFPAGGFLMSSQYWNAPDDASVEDKEELDEELSNYLAADAKFVLDQFSLLNQNDPTGRFTGKINLEKIGILGHSRGGKTVSRISSTDDRIKAAVIYDNIGPHPERASGLKQPMMTMRRPWGEAGEESLHGYLAKTGSYSYEVVLDSASHFTFSDMPIVDPENYKSEGDPVGNFHLVMDYTLDFLGKALKGEEGELLETDENSKGVRVKKFNSLK
ncbi:alpha/beta fold hydrolase [Marivirga sp.]|uniref:alpha/beta hydrolase family protein n=1 Tax=Marivirga sp. TaxID=2018662 RepID=UPI0025DF6ADA|nr:alpha/beta fold hydrolase [Marivirga sp.]